MKTTDNKPTKDNYIEQYGEPILTEKKLLPTISGITGIPVDVLKGHTKRMEEDDAKRLGNATSI